MQNNMVINRVYSTEKNNKIRRRLQKLIQERSDQSGFVLVELFSLLAGAFTGLLFFSASFISVFGLLEETAPELERWSVE